MTYACLLHAPELKQLADRLAVFDDDARAALIVEIRNVERDAEIAKERRGQIARRDGALADVATVGKNKRGGEIRSLRATDPLAVRRAKNTFRRD
jgi:hypothetical protein